MDSRVLVFGYYNKKNAGDDFFVEAFQALFPSTSFIFTDRITSSQLNEVKTVIFGGGSFLDNKLVIDDDALPLLFKKDILYIGVGLETQIDTIHKQLLQQAKLIAVRNKHSNSLQFSNIIYIPDLVYALPKLFTYQPNKNVLILPNFATVPQYDSPQWQYIAWEFFKLEFAQFLDYLIEKGYNINFFGLSQNHKNNDLYAATEIVNKMRRRNDRNIVLDESNYSSVSELFSKFGFVISQKYHGYILAEIINIPYISIYHHDKLKESYFDKGQFISYFGLNKQNLIDSFPPNEYALDVDRSLFDELKTKAAPFL